MRVFLDTEFYEFQPHHVSERTEIARSAPGANAVQLISLGAVREDGAEFYAENADFDWDTVPKDHWLQENVRPHLAGDPPWDGGWSGRGHNVQGGYFPVDEMAMEFHRFATNGPLPRLDDGSTLIGRIRGGEVEMTYSAPKFWGYFCDYDWMVLCGLYGRMKDLPAEFPMFCMDLKQFMVHLGVGKEDLPKQEGTAHHALADARWNKQAFDYLNDNFNGLPPLNEGMHL